jgi:hypothetical protein
MGQVADSGRCRGTVRREDLQALADVVTSVLATAGDEFYVHWGNRYVGEGEHQLQFRVGDTGCELTLELDGD